MIPIQSLRSRSKLPFISGVFLLGVDFSSLASAESRPNIVLLIADDLGYGELGCQGSTDIPTPHIDSLARDGVRFTAGYVTAAYCSPSRAGLMTGRYQTRFGYEFNPIGADNEDRAVGLPRREKTLAQRLKEVGYTTALIGKWHLGGHPAHHPRRRGFDEFFGFTHEGHFFLPPPYRGAVTMLRRKTLPDGARGRWTSSDGSLIYTTHMGHNEPPYDANNPIVRDGQPVVETAYLTDAFTREALDFIDRSLDRPFLLCLAYNAVHSPLQGADGYMKRFAAIPDLHRRIFAAMLANLDDSVGAVLDKLRTEGLDERTLIVFLSDNGGPTRELTSSNRPLRGEKGDLYEGGIRVPFLMRWTGTLPSRSVYEKPVIAFDIFATALAAAGIEASPTDRVDGVDLRPFLTGDNDASPHEVLFWRFRQRSAVRVGDWKLVRNSRRGPSDAWELFDLSRDVGETKDLAPTQPTKVDELAEIWRRIAGEMVEPIWMRR